MQFDRNVLIDDLRERVKECTAKVIEWRDLTDEQLNFREDESRWSVLECLEHLNLYGDFYLPELERRMLAANPDANAHVFHSGMIGYYFAVLMQVRNGKIRKMSTPADKNPAGSTLSIVTLDRFLKQQELLLTLLNEAGKHDLTRVKVSISLTRFIRLRLGDTLRFFIYHLERHVAQAARVVAVIPARVV